MATKKKHLFSPFKRNQMRWALAIYKWKKGISWNNYHLDILQALGKENLGDLPLSNKDVKRFVVEGRKTSEEKLEIFEKFIRLVLPDYLTDGNEEEHVISTAKSLAQFSNGNGKMGSYFLCNNDFHYRLPNECVFICPVLDKNVGVLKKIRSHPENTFEALEICVLRRISDTPFLFIQMFVIELPFELTKNSSVVRFIFNNPSYKDESFKDNAFIEIVRTILIRLKEFKFPNDLKIKDYRKGILIPSDISESYGLLSTDDESPVMVSLNTFKYGESSFAKKGIYITSENLEYENGKFNKDYKYLNHIKILQTHFDKDDEDKISHSKYLTVNTIPNVKEIALKMRLSLL